MSHPPGGGGELVVLVPMLLRSPVLSLVYSDDLQVSVPFVTGCSPGWCARAAIEYRRKKSGVQQVRMRS